METRHYSQPMETKEKLKGQSTITATNRYSIIFEGVRGLNYNGDIALDDISVLPGICSLQTTTGVTQPTVRPTLSSLQISTFETGLCGWIQDTSDTLNWTRKNRGTLSVGTGPRFDRRTQSTRGYYIYTEASGNSNKTARILSPAIRTSGTLCVSFWYHMYGSHINTLNMYLKNGGSLNKALWTKTGNQGNTWKNGLVDISAVNGNQVVFEGQTDSSYQGDIALDDIKILNGPCQTGTVCEFESSTICGYQQAINDNFDWTRGQRGTSSSGTGPPSDHTYGTGSGRYMYIESSAPRKQGDKARLSSPQYSPTNAMCLSFWYHMYGPDIGTLNVYISTYNRLNSPIITLQGNKGNAWKTAQTTIQSQTNFKVVFEGIRGNGYRGDLAKDDIKLTSGPCAGVGTCNFEKDLCGWTQRRDDKFDWIRRGTTPSVGTGPSSDHTLGSSTGYYMYIETSRPRRQGENAILQSQLNIALNTGTI